MEKIELKIEEIREIYSALFWATAEDLADRLAISSAMAILKSKVDTVFEEDQTND